MITIQNVFFKVKEIFICETALVTGAQNFISHNKVHGAQQAHITILREIFVIVLMDW